MKTWKSFLQLTVQKRLETNKILKEDILQLINTYAMYYKCDVNDVNLEKILI